MADGKIIVSDLNKIVRVKVYREDGKVVFCVDYIAKELPQFTQTITSNLDRMFTFDELKRYYQNIERKFGNYLSTRIPLNKELILEELRTAFRNGIAEK